MRIILSVIFAIIIGIAVIVAAYYQRGYFAIGAEYGLPILLLISLLYKYERNS